METVESEDARIARDALLDASGSRAGAALADSVAWNQDGAAATLYGRAHELDGSLRAVGPSPSGRERRVVEFEVTLTRVHAMNRKRSAARPDSQRPASRDRTAMHAGNSHVQGLNRRGPVG
jgi:hypothetical protein